MKDMSLKIQNPLVSIDWLSDNLDYEKLIILDCTIPKLTTNSEVNQEKYQIKGAIFFDIKNTFSDENAKLPNTVLPPKVFEEKARKIGINKDSILICYDDLGIYSSPRVWWMFQLMGFKNVAVLEGGLPAWREKEHPIEPPKKQSITKGDFKVKYQSEKLKFTEDILNSYKNKDVLIVDARSKGRFYGTEPEPRKDIRSGHIPNAVSLPYNEILSNGKMKSKEELQTVFKPFKNKKQIVFTCGSGITAAILALGAAISAIENVAVYDGSWTAWGSGIKNPIEK
jgi:thiosulfate/3-mercaptopyruvate sulfurtransferase